jgi:hypothetical protein
VDAEQNRVPVVCSESLLFRCLSITSLDQHSVWSKAKALADILPSNPHTRPLADEKETKGLERRCIAALPYSVDTNTWHPQAFPNVHARV